MVQENGYVTISSFAVSILGIETKLNLKNLSMLHNVQNQVIIIRMMLIYFEEIILIIITLCYINFRRIGTLEIEVDVQSVKEFS